jgi:two-component system CheB/CheR fusion protein
VGIGASAGGLEAFEQFLRHVPAESGMAFVVVQHLDPTHKGMLVELLRRVSEMPVVEASDGLEVLSDHVYVIAPGHDMSLLRGRLYLLPQTVPRGLNLPIDFFFRSLAVDRQEAAIGVVLSGMGSDGTLGLRAIKEKAGAAFVQSLTSARFDGMPRSAIDAGVADVVAPVEELPRRILAYRAHASHIGRPEPVPEGKLQSALDKVFVLLRAQTGNDFSLYKKSTLYRRIERRMGLHQIDGIATYVRFLRENPREIELLFKELLIGVTCFFRDPEVWEHLVHETLPALLSERQAAGVLRAWVPGCSTGEEAYSLAMAFREAADPFKTTRNVTLQVFATDLDHDAIERARQGLYPESVAADVTPERLRRFFVQEERGYRITSDIREMVVFASQNLIMDPPFTKLDFVSCRNVLIYLSGELQKKLIPLFHYSLKSGGVLMLGSAETVGSFSGLFATLDSKLRLYRRLEHTAVPIPVDFPSLPSRLLAGSGSEFDNEGASQYRPGPLNLQTLADRVLVSRFSPLAVLCNDKGDVLYISGRAGKYLEPPVGKANLNVFAMARDGLRGELSGAFAAALREDRVVMARNIKVGTNGGTQYIDLNVQRLSEPKELQGTVMIVIADVPSPPPATRAAKSRGAAEPRPHGALEQELERVRDEMQMTREEMQTSQEELKSTNEELQSTNEELQSTNEELTTSKEEMQSLNEELQTVNHELQSKVDELSRSNNDMKNLLNSTDIATLFLDAELRVRRFTNPTAKIIKLIQGDAGRPITDIASDLNYPELADDARDVLSTLVFKEKHASTRDGRWFSVRIMPYRTLENVIDGVVITFTDASASRTLEQVLRQQANQLRQMAECLPSLVWSCRADGSCDYLSPQWLEYTGVPDSEQLGYGWLEQVHPDDRERVREEWQAAVNAGKLYDLEFRLRGASGVYRWFKALSRPIRDADGSLSKWYGTTTDIDDLKRAEQDRAASADRLASMLESIGEGFIGLDGAFCINFFNATAERLLGRSREQVMGKAFWAVFPKLRDGEIAARFNRARDQQVPMSFEAQLGTSASELFRVRLYPRKQGDGMSMFLEVLEQREPGGGDS